MILQEFMLVQKLKSITETGSKTENLLYKKLIVLFFIFLFLSIFFSGMRADITADEVEFYYRFNMADLFEGKLSIFLEIFQKTDHFPFYFIIHGFVFHLFKSVYMLRILSLFYVMVSIFYIRNIFILKQKSENFLIVYLIFFLFTPAFLFSVIFSSKYNFALMFLIISYYQILKVNEKIYLKQSFKTVFFLIICFAAHYLTAPFIFIFISKIKNKALKIFSFALFLILVILVLFNFRLIFQNIDMNTGESKTTVLSTTVENSFTKLTDVIKMTGGAVINPGIYREYRVYNKYNLYAGFIIFILIIIPSKNVKYDSLIYVFSYITGFFILTFVTERLWNIRVLEPDRLLFIFPFANYRITQLFFEKKYYSRIILIVLMFFYSTGIYFIFHDSSFDLQNIEKILSVKNNVKIFSRADLFSQEFDEISMLSLYYNNFEKISEPISEKEFYVFSNRDLDYIKNKSDKDFLKIILKKYGVEEIYSGKNYYLHRVFNSNSQFN